MNMTKYVGLAAMVAALGAGPAFAQAPGAPITPQGQQTIGQEKAHESAHDEALHKDKEVRQDHEAAIKHDDAALHHDEKDGNAAAARREAAAIHQNEKGLHQDKRVINHQKHDLKKDRRIDQHVAKTGH
jgi:hypothetical protein